MSACQSCEVVGSTWLHFGAVHRDLLGAQLAQLWSQADILQGQPLPCSGMHMAPCMRICQDSDAAGEHEHYLRSMHVGRRCQPLQAPPKHLCFPLTRYPCHPKTLPHLRLHDGEVQLLLAAVRRQVRRVLPQALVHPTLTCAHYKGANPHC